MNDWLSYLVPVILIGYIIYNVIRLYFNRKLNKERKSYEQIVNEQMAKLEQDVFERSRDLQDSMQMITQEYAKLMKDMSLQQREDAQTLLKRMREFKDTPEGGSPKATDE